MCGRAGDALVLYLGHVVYIYCRSKMPFDGKEMLQSNTFGSPTVYGLLTKAEEESSPIWKFIASMFCHNWINHLIIVSMNLESQWHRHSKNFILYWPQEQNCCCVKSQNFKNCVSDLPGSTMGASTCFRKFSLCTLARCM